MYRLVYDSKAFYEYKVQKKIFFGLYWKTIYEGWYRVPAENYFDNISSGNDPVVVLKEYP